MNFDIGGTKIGNNQPTYIIAEIGINHNGDEETAKRCIDAAVAAKVSAVKFQKRHLPSLYIRNVLDHPENYEQYFQYMIPLLKEVELSEKSYIRLKKYCEEKGVDFLCTAFDTISADFLHDIDIAAFKFASADLTNIPLLLHVANFCKPMILSTGMSSWSEVEKAVSVLKKIKGSFALLHCRSVYPVWPRDVNLIRINRLKEFGVPVGYSGHETGITISLVAASMGANIIERHFTLDNRQKGPDHKISLEPHELKRLVRDIRVADQAMGREKRYMLRGEVLNRELFAKSLIANGNIVKGSVIDESMIRVQGPGKGLSPNRLDDLIGIKSNRDISSGSFFVEDDLKSTNRPHFNSLFKSQWGLIARFTDYKEMLAYSPRIMEFHLAEKDFEIPFSPEKELDCKLVVHAPEYINDKLLDLCSANSEIRKKSIDLILKTLELAKDISGYFHPEVKVIAHPGAMSLQAKLDADVLKNALSKSLTEIRQQSTDPNIELIFENLPPYPWYFGGQWKGNYFMDCAEIVTFCKDHNSRICFDLSHAALYCNAKEKKLSEYVQDILPYTCHLHLADGYGLDGEGVQFGEGDIDLTNILPLFCDFKGTWVPEIWRGHLNEGQGFMEALDYLQQYLD